MNSGNNKRKPSKTSLSERSFPRKQIKPDHQAGNLLPGSHTLCQRQQPTQTLQPAHAPPRSIRNTRWDTTLINLLYMSLSTSINLICCPHRHMTRTLITNHAYQHPTKSTSRRNDKCMSMISRREEIRRLRRSAHSNHQRPILLFHHSLKTIGYMMTYMARETCSAMREGWTSTFSTSRMESHRHHNKHSFKSTTATGHFWTTLSITC